MIVFPVKHDRDPSQPTIYLIDSPENIFLIVMTFCAKCGKEHTEEDVYCSRCGAYLKERGDTVTEVVDLEYPESENPLVELVIPVSGRLELQPGGEKLVDGTITYDIPEWKPLITEEADRVQIKQDERWLHTHWDRPKNDWSLNLGSARPYRLKVKTGVSRGRISLGGLPLTDLHIGAGVGDCTIRFEDPNPESMQLLRIESGVGQTDVAGLLNANAREVKIVGGVGHVKLGFTGKKPEHDTHARVEAGVGGFELVLDKDVSAVIRVNGLAGVDMRGAVRVRSRSFGSGVYETDAYTSEGPTMDIRVTMGLGGLTIRAV